MEVRLLVDFKLIISVFFLFGFLASQETQKKIHLDYISSHSLSIHKNTINEFNFKKDTLSKKGFGIDISTLHGIKILKRFTLSTGLGLHYDNKEKIIYTPLIFDLRFYSSQDFYNSLYIYLQTGPNIKWSKTSNGEQFNAKLGLGAIVSDQGNFAVSLEVFINSAQLYVFKEIESGLYNLDTVGLSLGFIID